MDFAGGNMYRKSGFLFTDVRIYTEKESKKSFYFYSTVSEFFCLLF